MTIEKPKPKQLLRPITTGTNSAMNQSQFLLSLYLKKAGLASRNIVHLPKRSFYVVSTSAFIFFILYVKPIRSLLIQRTPAGSSFRLFALTFYNS